MGNVAFVFPGQGSQYVGMGRSLYERNAAARAVFDAADRALGENLSRLILEGPEEALRLTRTTQPALLTVSVAMHAALAARGEKADIVAGHSLGEYSALVVAGALEFSDAVRAVRLRGSFMQEAVPPGVGAMAAVVRLPAEKVQEICAAVAGDQVCVAVSFNSPEQTVIGGHAAAIERAAQALAAAGARRVLPLPVSAPFHCPLMEPVKPRMREVIERLHVAALTLPVVSNVEAAPNTDAGRVVDLLVEQMTSPVRWVQSVRAMVSAGVTRFVEVGPGKVLTNLIKQTDKTVDAVALDEPETLETLLD